MQSVINDFKLQETRYYDYNNIRAYELVESFIIEKDWEEFIHMNDSLEKITKEQLVAFANEKFKDNNYVVVYKRTGEDPNIHKVDKPKLRQLKSIESCNPDLPNPLKIFRKCDLSLFLSIIRKTSITAKQDH